MWPKNEAKPVPLDQLTGEFIHIGAVKSGKPGGLAIDVYEQEEGLFFRDLSCAVIADDVIQRLMAFPNVIVTGHQAYLTREAIDTILKTTPADVSDFAAGRPLVNEVHHTLAPAAA